MRYGRTSSSALSTFSTVSGRSSRFGSSASSSSASAPAASAAYGLMTSPSAPTDGVPASLAFASAAAGFSSFSQLSAGVSVHLAAPAAWFPTGISVSAPPRETTHSPIHRSCSARRFARVAVALFANAATRTLLAVSSP